MAVVVKSKSKLRYNMKQMYQVNATYNYGEVYFWVSLYCVDGYMGIMIDSTSFDDCKATNWAVYVSSHENCLNWMRDHDPNDYI